MSFLRKYFKKYEKFFIGHVLAVFALVRLIDENEN